MDPQSFAVVFGFASALAGAFAVGGAVLALVDRFRRPTVGRRRRNG